MGRESRTSQSSHNISAAIVKVEGVGKRGFGGIIFLFEFLEKNDVERAIALVASMDPVIQFVEFVGP